jgi:rifampicin phosphotransferase
MRRRPSIWWEAKAPRWPAWRRRDCRFPRAFISPPRRIDDSWRRTACRTRFWRRSRQSRPNSRRRSSATAEDLPDLSFAGQQETYLNVRGEAGVVAAVKRCWASLWTARAIGYRARQGIGPQEVSLAVVVQELVPADAAGILFTANPLTGARDELMINAAWGLGEAIVSGQVTPDTLVVDRASGRIIRQETSRKDVQTVRTDQGTREEPVPAERRTQAVLSSTQAAELARIGNQIERLYGGPMDVEWTLQGDRFFVLQARPITALSNPLERVERPS